MGNRKGAFVLKRGNPDARSTSSPPRTCFRCMFPAADDKLSKRDHLLSLEKQELLHSREATGIKTIVRQRASGSPEQNKFPGVDEGRC